MSNDAIRWSLIENWPIQAQECNRVNQQSFGADHGLTIP
jgi:hypothetical protein